VDSSRAQTTETLLAYATGDRPAADALMPLVYDELRGLARKYLRAERRGHTLQPTALVHEAYLRMVDVSRIDWRGKTHFFALAARQMRRILVEHARARGAAKRGGGARAVTLEDHVAVDSGTPDDLLALDEALSRLAEIDPRRARVAELKLFAGLSVEELAVQVEMSERTVKDDWRVARAWLLRELTGTGG
jgi:RNA polymerase sigma factor (TIGR02999 family)